MSIVNKVGAIILIAVTVQCMPLPVAAEISDRINFQGRLTDSEGTPLSDGDYALTFAIYDSLTGGELLWQETQSAVSITDGIFDTQLPESGTFPPDLFDGSLYIGISVESDTEMIPRQPLTAVPFAFKARDADALQGHSAGDFSEATHAHAVDWYDILNRPSGLDDGDDAGTAGTELLIDTLTHDWQMSHNYNFQTGADYFFIRDETNDALRLTIDGTSGKVSVGQFHAAGDARFEAAFQAVGEATFESSVYVGGDLRATNGFNILNAEENAVFHTGWRGDFGDYTTISSGYAWGAGEPVSVVAGALGVFFTRGDDLGTPHSEVLAKIDSSGLFSCNVLEIKGGMDLAEPFDVLAQEEIKPGMLMSIDPASPGQLQVTDQPYDTRLAGVVSGAGGVKPGVILSQEGAVSEHSMPVALSGRVFCLADTSNGPIQPGDMLTSSSQRGYAMKATDRDRSYGAVIGKAMTGLEDGSGEVLVLVSLQ